MNIVETKAPISIEDLKLYFNDNETFYNIDYTTSDIKSEKLLVYISNLDIPCNIKFNSEEEIEEMIGVYLNSNFLVNIESLELKAMDLLFQEKGIIKKRDLALLEKYSEEIDTWATKLESLTLFNMYMLNSNEIKEWITESHPTDDTSELTGVNFLSLLKYEMFYSYYQKMTQELKYFSTYFNEYMFKGKNLYSYWANENNPMFILTYHISQGTLNVEEYHKTLLEAKA
jgi:hypothetical protein